MRSSVEPSAHSRMCEHVRRDDVRLSERAAPGGGGVEAGGSRSTSGKGMVARQGGQAGRPVHGGRRGSIAESARSRDHPDRVVLQSRHENGTGRVNRSHPKIEPRRADPADVSGLTELINLAFEIESEFVSGRRIDETEVGELVEKQSLWLVDEVGGGAQACVNLELLDERRGRFGLLAVHPATQTRGLGRFLVGYSERWLCRCGRSRVEILVVDRREVLRNWYERLGYRTVATRPFTQPERLLKPCRFLVMSKDLQASGTAGI